MSSNLLDNLKVILIVFVFVALIIPLIKKLAIYVGAVDIPGGRHIHTKGLNIKINFINLKNH